MILSIQVTNGKPFSILDWIVFSGTRLPVQPTKDDIQLSVSSTGSFSLEQRERDIERLRNTSFSILDWIVFSGTLPSPRCPKTNRNLSVSSTGSFSLELGHK